MRLLNVHDLTFHEYYGDKKRPEYAIASHRWNTPFEATLKDVQKRRNTEGLGYQKIRAFAKYVQDHIPSVDWLWIDTCCIDQTNAAELSEAVNLMFEWYRDAEVCLAYLADVEAVEDKSSFRRSEWFTRGWTLQELLAPRTVVFLTKTWNVIGNKGGSICSYGNILIGPSLEQEVAAITKVPEQVLHNYKTSLNLSVDEKLKWMDSRRTTREEDMFYALYGIFDVSLGANYGEKQERARERLLAAIHQRENLFIEQAERFKKIADWLSAPDPWTNHDTARNQHEPSTGNWLLHTDQYQAWKSGAINYFWIYGQPGCGKTILCSTAIEDIRAYCRDTSNYAQIIFYFSFSDISKQSYEDLVRSLVVQLGWKEPGLSLLRQAYEKPDRKLPGLDELQKIMLACIASYNVVFLHLDALDECPDGGEIRLTVLKFIEDLLRQAPNIRMLATTRDVPKVRNCMEALGAERLSIAACTVDPDIQKYISSQMLRDRRLSRLDLATKTLIEETFAEKANGMFRWAYCQLLELKKFKSTQPNRIKAALLALPATLGETYERMLASIHVDDSQQALTLLRWIVYAESPRSLNELAEACIINPSDDASLEGIVDTNNRGDWEDALEILSGFVLIEGMDEGDLHDGTSSRHIERYAKIRLAHFSIKEFLESAEIRQDHLQRFHLDPAKEHTFLAQSCLVYLRHYSNSRHKTRSEEDFLTFPLLKYAAKRWYFHAALKQCNTTNIRELFLLTSKADMYDWLIVHEPDRYWIEPFGYRLIVRTDAGLYYASYIGLKQAVEMLVERGADVNAWGGEYGNALQAASKGGYGEIIELLLERGADVNARGGEYGNALYVASYEGFSEIVNLLLERGADVHAQSGFCGNALQAASYRGHSGIVKLLIEQGADVHAQGGFFGNALQAASFSGHSETVKLLLERGADVHAQGGKNSNALQAASLHGYGEIVKQLLERGADVNMQVVYYGNALQAASSQGHVDIVKLLLEQDADINARGGPFSNALYAASQGGHTDIVRLLENNGLLLDNIHRDNLGRSELHLSASYGYYSGIQSALDMDHDINEIDSQHWTALHWAAYFGETEVVRLLLKAHADPTLVDWQARTAQHVAVVSGHRETATAFGILEEIAGDKDVCEHSGAFCDSCGHDIMGTRHRCTLCSDLPGYDLCFRCIRDVDALHPVHVFTTEPIA